MNARGDNYTFLTTGPVGRVIARMAVPTIISMLVTSVYNIVDTYYVGLINTQATAAVGVAFPLQSVIQAVGFFFGQGSGTYISRQLGAKKHTDACQMASTAFVGAMVAGVVIAVVGLLLLTPISVWCGSTPTILPYTEKYLAMVLLGAPFMTGSMLLNNQMRFQGNAANAMYGMMTGAVLNVVLVPIFTFTLGMGILGTGIGTALSQIFGFVVLLVMSYHGDNIHIKLGDACWKWHYYVEMIKGGTPSLTRQGLAAVAVMLLNLAAGVYGDAAIAGMSIVGRLCFLVFAVIIGVGQGFQPFCGFNYGARLFKRVRQGYFFCIKLDMCILAVCCIPGFVYASELIDLMRHDPAVVAVGAVALRWQVVTWPLAAVITVSNMCLQTSGRTIPANILAACRNGLCFIPLILTLPHLLCLLGVEITQAVADVFSFAIAVPLMSRYFKSLK